jgi:hypothetical protein
MTKTRSIPTLLFPYRNYSAAKRSLESIVECADLLKLYVIESPSDKTDSLLKPYFIDMVDAGLVEKYILFDDNISNNSLLLSLRMLREEIEDSKYTILSDLDLFVPRGLIEEQVNIVAAHEEIFACGMQVDYSSWGESLADLAEYHRALQAERSAAPTPYIPFWSGMWMTMFRTAELYAAVDAAVENGCRLTDGVVGRFGRLLFRKGWVITREHVGQDFTRGLPPDDDYRTIKEANKLHFAAYSPEGPALALYNHDLVADGAIYHDRIWRRFTSPPLDPPALKQFRSTWEEDPVARAVAAAQRSFASAYVSWKPPRTSYPAGLYIWLRDAGELQTPNSLVSFGGDKAIVHLGDEPVAPALRGLSDEVHLLDFFHPKGAEHRARALRAASELVRPDGLVYIHSPAATERLAVEALGKLQTVFSTLGLRPPQPDETAVKSAKHTRRFQTGLVA